MGLPAALIAAGPMLKTAGVAIGSTVAFDVGLRALFGGGGDRQSQDRAAFAQASLNRLANVGVDTMFDPRDSLMGVRDQFLADTIGQFNTRQGRMVEQTATAGAFRDVLFGRANQIRMASMQTQPHPLEMLAGIRSFMQ